MMVFYGGRPRIIAALRIIVYDLLQASRLLAPLSSPNVEAKPMGQASVVRVQYAVISYKTNVRFI